MVDFTYEHCNTITNSSAQAPGYMVIADLDYLAVLVGNNYLYRYNKQYFISEYILLFSKYHNISLL